MKRFNSNKWFARVVGLLALLLVIQLGRFFFTEKEKEIRHFLYAEVKQKYPLAAKKYAQSQGLKLFKKDTHSLPTDIRGTVILIHGLDEPGLVWMNLAPALHRQGFKVLVMTYPNDQSIRASTTFFFNQMLSCFAGDEKAVSIVAHSMGGLIARDMLTDPLFAYSQKSEQGRLPFIHHLILVGTPNHGAPLARFRVFTEVRDQLHNFFHQETHWLNPLLDGTGEAGIDLLPGSRFLTQLNSRPLPSHVDIQVIAGMITPWSASEITPFVQHLEQKLPPKTRPAVRTLEQTLVSMSRTIGDGLVSVASAQLNGVPLTTVQGTHLTMIRNVFESSQRIPPAVPIILKILSH
jgi:pimeloyl-ACP methyl ester carboxylesterase